MTDEDADSQGSVTRRILENFEQALRALPEFDEAAVGGLLEVARQEGKPKAADIEAALAVREAPL